MLADGKRSMQKLEDDNSRLQRVLEQSMITVNRMSLDSDNSVDRWGVPYLVVSFFVSIGYGFGECINCTNGFILCSSA
jgi:hypothetical protein